VTDAVCVDELFQSAAKITHNSAHVLQPLIPDRPASSYDPRPRTHDKLLLDKTSYLNDREFVIRMLYTETAASELCLNFLLILCYLLFIFVRFSSKNTRKLSYRKDDRAMRAI